MAHGDIKSENILVTSSLWIYLTDFASFKPVELPLDDPSDFSYYFDTSGRRTCYLAPERFYTVPTTSARDGQRERERPTQKKEKAVVTEAMDLFSLGCVLAELFCDGVPPFSLSQLFRYRSGDYIQELANYFKQIEDPSMMSMISSMCSLAPEDRLTCTQHLATANFPDWFSDMHDYVANLNDITSPHLAPNQTPISMNASTITTTLNSPKPAPSVDLPNTRREPVLKSDADERLERLTMDWETLVDLLLVPPEGFRRAPRMHDVNQEVDTSSVSYSRFDRPPAELIWL